MSLRPKMPHVALSILGVQDHHLASANAGPWIHFWNVFFSIHNGLYMLFDVSSEVIYAELWMAISTLKFPRPCSISPLLQTFPPTVTDISPTRDIMTSADTFTYVIILGYIW